MQKQDAVYLAHCETAAKWYLNNQCSDERPWGGVRMSADNGRFLYEVYKGTKERRGAGYFSLHHLPSPVLWLYQTFSPRLFVFLRFSH